MTTTRTPQASLAPVLQPVRVRRKRRRLWWVVGIVLALFGLAVAGLLGAAWYFSSQLLDVTHEPDSYSLRVLALHGSTVDVTRNGDSSRQGTFGLMWHGGRALVGAIVASDARSVRRRISGNTQGLKVGTPVRIDGWLYASPAAFHQSYRTLSFPDPLGRMPAWYVPGRRRTWVILVHGYGATRREGLRSFPVLEGLGLPVLDIAYRNDVGAPPSPDHLYHLGASEWEDVQAGVRYALSRGAHDVILDGYSMGGGVVESFLHHSAYAPRVRAVVLDSPAVDWNRVLDLQAGKRNLPGVLTAVAKRVVAYRLGLSSLDDLDAIRNAGQLRAPTLLFQGTADTTVGPGGSTALAHARPDIITFVSVPGAEHTEEWNVDPNAYDARLKAFLLHVLH
jgi:pimeloyl-ACP methyl ester carboxylesterase